MVCHMSKETLPERGTSGRYFNCGLNVFKPGFGKQASSKQASTREIRKNHNSVVMLRVWPKILVDATYGCEPETQWWRPGTGVASAGPPFQNLQFRAKIGLFLLKTALELAENSQM